MTHIVDTNKYPSKKAFKEAIKKNEDIFLEDPSIFNPVSGTVVEVLTKKKYIVVTNSQKRSWFAELELTPKGVVVK